MDDTEKWCAVVGYEGLYEVSNFGNVRALPRTVRSRGGWTQSFAGKTLSAEVTKHGYLRVPLSKNGKQTKRSVHCLVCEAFHGPRPLGREVAHLDGVRRNCRADNLRWATHAENISDKHRHGTVQCGLKSGLTFLSEAQVRRIRTTTGRTITAIAADYGCHFSTVSNIRRRKTWKYLED